MTFSVVFYTIEKFTWINVLSFFISEDGLALELEPPLVAGPAGSVQPVAAQAGYNTYGQNSFESGRSAYKTDEAIYNQYYTG